jgi:hypothetical protein
LIEAVENLSPATESAAVTSKKHKVKRAEKGVPGVLGVAGVQGGGFADQEWPQKNAKKDEEKSHAKQTSPHLPL